MCCEMTYENISCGHVDEAMLYCVSGLAYTLYLKAPPGPVCKGIQRRHCLMNLPCSRPRCTAVPEPATPQIRIKLILREPEDHMSEGDEMSETTSESSDDSLCSSIEDSPSPISYPSLDPVRNHLSCPVPLTEEPTRSTAKTPKEIDLAPSLDELSEREVQEEMDNVSKTFRLKQARRAGGPEPEPVQDSMTSNELLENPVRIKKNYDFLSPSKYRAVRGPLSEGL